MNAKRSSRLLSGKENVSDADQTSQLAPFEESIFAQIYLSFVINYISFINITINNVIILLTLSSFMN